MISRRGLITLGGAAAAAGTLAGADAFAIEPGFRLAVNEWTVRHEAWPRLARPLRIGVLADIHAVDPWMPVGRIEGIVARMNALKPDITVLLGDYVNALRPRYYSKLVPVVDWAAALGHLRAPLGVYAVLGNHDWWAGEAGSIRRAFEKNAIHLLENEAVMASGGGAVFWIAGLGDQLVYHDHGVDDLAKTLGKISGGAPVILAAHEPSIFNRLPSRVTLTLAGHTHGGQVYVPFAGRPALSEEMARYAHGHIVEHGRHMIVSSGLGLSGWPVRFLVPPEIVVVTLKNSVV